MSSCFSTGFEKRSEAVCRYVTCPVFSIFSMKQSDFPIRRLPAPVMNGLEFISTS